MSAGGKLHIWDLNCSVLDPIISLTLEEKLSCLNFASRSPIVITGDDNGSISVFKICKGSKDVSADDKLQDTDNGIISPVFQLPLQQTEQIQWRAKEAQKLQDVIASKLTVNVVV